MMRVLLVDDDSPNLELYRLAFSIRGHVVLTAHSGQHAIGLFATEHPDAVICDLILGDMVGTEAIERMRAIGVARFYLLSEAETMVLATAAERSGVTGFQKLDVAVSDVVRAVSDDFATAVAWLP